MFEQYMVKTVHTQHWYCLSRKNTTSKSSVQIIFKWYAIQKITYTSSLILSPFQSGFQRQIYILSIFFVSKIVHQVNLFLLELQPQNTLFIEFPDTGFWISSYFICFELIYPFIFWIKNKNKIFPILKIICVFLEL